MKSGKLSLYKVQRIYKEGLAILLNFLNAIYKKVSLYFEKVK